MGHLQAYRGLCAMILPAMRAMLRRWVALIGVIVAFTWSRSVWAQSASGEWTVSDWSAGGENASAAVHAAADQRYVYDFGSWAGIAAPTPIATEPDIRFDFISPAVNYLNGIIAGIQASAGPSARIINRVTIDHVLNARVFLPGLSFREATEMVVDSIIVRDVQPLHGTVLSLTRGLFRFGLPTSDAQLSQMPVLRAIKESSMHVSAGVIVLGLVLQMMTLFTSLPVGSFDFGSIIRRGVGMLVLIGLIANAHALVYGLNGIINGIAEVLCPEYQCLQTQRVVSLLFPQKRLELIPDLIRIFSIVIYTIGVSAAFLNRWVLGTLVAWLAPIALATMLLPAGSGAFAAWVGAYLRLAISTAAVTAAFLLVGNIPQFAAGSDARLSAGIAAAFSFFLLTESFLCGWQAARGMGQAIVRGVREVVVSVTHR